MLRTPPHDYPWSWTKCGRKVLKKTCESCPSDTFTWANTLDVGHQGGNRRQKSKSGFATKKKANTALANVQVGLSKGTYVAPSRQTVAGFLTDEWLPGISSTIRPTTHRSYQLHVERHINPRIGTYRIQQLSGSHLNAFLRRTSQRGTTERTRRPGSCNSAPSPRHRSSCIPRCRSMGTHHPQPG